jgi:6-pyruvoyltetrahydropterin/6-carboxytetrahydropterin synthase
MLLAATDPHREAFAPFAERVVLMEEGDPTTEVLARHLFLAVVAAFRPGMEVTSPGGATYRVPPTVSLDRIRVWETTNTWGEYGEDRGTGG